MSKEKLPSLLFRLGRRSLSNLKNESTRFQLQVDENKVKWQEIGKIFLTRSTDPKSTPPYLFGTVPLVEKEVNSVQSRSLMTFPDDLKKDSWLTDLVLPKIEAIEKDFAHYSLPLEENSPNGLTGNELDRVNEIFEDRIEDSEAYSEAIDVDDKELVKILEESTKESDTEKK